MSGDSIIFDDEKIKKSNFHKNNKLFKIDDIDVDKILISKKESYGTNTSFKYFIRYSDNDGIKPLCIKLSEMVGYVQHFESDKRMSFKVIDNNLLKKYISSLEKISSQLVKNFIVNLFKVIMINI